MFSDTAIQLQPVFAQWIQNTHALAPGVTAPGETALPSSAAILVFVSLLCRVFLLLMVIISLQILRHSF
jgi:hypothetical protein